MKIILGLNSFHADSSAAIFLDNKLIYAIEEERINRIKHWAGLPIHSIKACLRHCKLTLKDITDITINTNPRSNLKEKSFYFLKNYILGEKKFEIFQRLKNKYNLKYEIENNVNDKFNKKLKIHYIDHHLSHLASAFFPSEFSEAAGLSIDGFGDFCSLAIGYFKNNKIKIIKKIFFPHSLGLLYEAFTQLIGFDKYGEEYKMMGLSCYGVPKYTDIIKNNFFSNYPEKKLNLIHFNHINKNYIYNFSGQPNQKKIFKDHVKSFFTKNEKFSIEEIKDISASIQKVYEDQLINILEYIKKVIPTKNLVFAGGCALNSLANRKLYDFFENIFIPYAPGDSGGSIGSALLYLSKYFTKFENLKNPYLGANYSNSEIELEINKFIFKKKITIIKFKNEKLFLDEITKLLIEKKVIGLFSGSMEFGARALGNRSIIANPIHSDMKDIINKKIKRRENFRPFAPAVMIDKKNEWFDNSRLNPYMSNVEFVKKEKRSQIPAVTHFDGTGRVQTVSKETNSSFYKIIEHFFSKTGVPILLNTSFNENEPIVMNPEQALACFDRTDMDAIVLGDFVIKNQ